MMPTLHKLTTCSSAAQYTTTILQARQHQTECFGQWTVEQKQLPPVNSWYQCTVYCACTRNNKPTCYQQCSRVDKSYILLLYVLRTKNTNIDLYLLYLINLGYIIHWNYPQFYKKIYFVKKKQCILKKTSFECFCHPGVFFVKKTCFFFSAYHYLDINEFIMAMNV